jgi:Ca2+-binding RTX toxin-like protein
MAESSGTWGRGYAAQHVALPEEWDSSTGILTQVSLRGKNRYADIFNGVENDTALLYLSDSENGDALFLDDVYSAFPDSEQCERLSHITAIYAGRGDDIIDLTTDKFEFAGAEVKVYGGDGDDVIWGGADTACTFYGDKGDDSLIGSSRNDCFIGGAGDDVIHGGGGKDLFAYGDPSSWGNDIIYQLQGEGNSITLFFEQKELKDQLLTEEIDGGMRISVAGAANSSITIYSSGYSLVFGSQCDQFEVILAAGGCGECASQNIFETGNNG